jgi:myo-inositol 2-dehydrogenase/D-chiro-inositol 1-dehydrogenase
MIASAHALAARTSGLNIVAVASRSERSRTKLATDLGVHAVEYDRLPAGADVVVVATPPAQHFDHAAHALERGAAVILEKPLVLTLNEADRLVDLTARHGERLLYAENLAYAPIVHALIGRVARAVEGGSVIDHLSVRTIQPLPTWGNFTSPEWGGGALFDLGVHPLAVAVLVARAARAGEVVGVRATMRGDVTDTHAEVVLIFESGLQGTVVSSWEGGPVPCWDVQVSSATDVVRAELLPTLVLEHNGDPIGLPAATAPVPMIEDFGYVGQMRAFLDDIAHGRPPFMDAAFGRWILEIVCACYVSAARDGAFTTVPSGCDRTRTPVQLWKTP